MKDFNKGALGTYAKKEVEKKEETGKPEKQYNRKAKQYKIVGVRFTQEEYNKILKKAVKYESMSDYIKTLINKDINK